MRRIAPLFVTILLAACTTTTTQQPAPSSARSSMPGSPVALKTYVNAAGGYSIGYPEGWTMQENTRFEGPEVTEVGTVFVPPASDTAGTNMVKAQVEVVALDGACPVIENPQQEPAAVIDGASFEHTLWGDVSNGNTEETITYQAYKNGKCYRMVYYRYLCTPGSSCTPDRTIHFAPGPQVHQFEAMARSFKFR